MDQGPLYAGGIERAGSGEAGYDAYRIKIGEEIILEVTL